MAKQESMEILMKSRFNHSKQKAELSALSHLSRGFLRRSLPWELAEFSPTSNITDLHIIAKANQFYNVFCKKDEVHESHQWVCHVQYNAMHLQWGQELYSLQSTFSNQQRWQFSVSNKKYFVHNMQYLERTQSKYNTFEESVNADNHITLADH